MAADANEAEARRRVPSGHNPYAGQYTSPYAAAAGSTFSGSTGPAGQPGEPANASSGSTEQPVSRTMDMSKMKYSFDAKKSTESGVRLSVSRVIPHRHYPQGYVYVFFTKIHRSLWYYENKFLKEHIQPYIDHELTAKGVPVPLYLETLDDIATCQPSDPHNYKRSRNGWTVNKPYMIICVRNGMASLEKYVSDAFNSLASNFRPNSQIGVAYADWLRTNKSHLYNSETGETGKRRKISHDQFVQSLQDQLVQAFSTKTIEYNVPLDKMITYGHIKEFLVERCGYSHWRELPRDMKRGILSKPLGQYPLWDETEVKSYDKDYD